jgi:hypothetical protein
MYEFLSRIERSVRKELIESVENEDFRGEFPCLTQEQRTAHVENMLCTMLPGDLAELDVDWL